MALYRDLNLVKLPAQRGVWLLGCQCPQPTLPGVLFDAWWFRIYPYRISSNEEAGLWVRVNAPLIHQLKDFETMIQNSL